MVNDKSKDVPRKLKVEITDAIIQLIVLNEGSFEIVKKSNFLYLVQCVLAVDGILLNIVLTLFQNVIPLVPNEK